MYDNISDMMSFYDFLGSCMVNDPLWPLPTCKIRALKKLRAQVLSKVSAMVAEKAFDEALHSIKE